MPEPFAPSEDGVGMQTEALSLLVSEQFIACVICDVQEAVVALVGQRRRMEDAHERLLKPAKARSIERVLN